VDAPTIIRNPIITEKLAEMARDGKYAFVVASSANKAQIKKAISEIFKVNVVDVNTMITHGKKRRVRYRVGRRPDRKKAIVTLKEGDKIELT
jgi:large subunit ribosomal protein L23